MKLFLSQSAALNAESNNDHFCKVLDVFAGYIRATDRKTVTVLVSNKADQAAMNLTEVSNASK